MKRSPPDSEWDGDLIIHNLPAPEGMIECETVLDIGSGIRPMNWYKPKQHICLDPYDPYLERLAGYGYKTICSTAKHYLTNRSKFIYDDDFEAIYMLDVIEHMHKNEGQEVIELAKEVTGTQLIIFTPKGFMEQTEDAWGLGGHEWQTHRSGWLPGEFPGWRIQMYAKGFFASWNS